VRRGSTSCVVPRALANTGSSSRELTSSSERDRFEPARAPRCVSAFLGVSFPIAISAAEIHLPSERPKPALRSALGVSRALDGFLSPRPRGLVSSHYHVRDSPFRGLSPTTKPKRLVDASCPLVVHSLLPVAEFPRRRQLQRARLQGFSGWRSAAIVRVVNPRDARSPLRLCSFGLISGYLGRAFTPPPLVTFAASSCV
jgi:hypothetical protein